MADNNMQEIIDRVRNNCKVLKLSYAFVEKAVDLEKEVGNGPFLVTLDKLLISEVGRRSTLRIDKLSNSGGFPVRYSSDEFDTTNVSFPDGESLNSMLELPFLSGTPKRNVIMYGKPGSGLSMLSIILGEAACEKGYATRFIRTADLAELLEEKGTRKVSKMLSKVQLLILDEFGYTPINLEPARMLFNLVSSFEGKKSIILNTCVEFSKWIEVLGDNHLGSSFAGKMVNGGYLILFSGSDRRFETMHTKKAP